MALRAMDLYDAYDKNMLPKDEGYVVSGFYMTDSPYTIIEVVSYAEVKNFHASKDSLTFQADGKKIYIMVEPSSYNQKSTEPYLRPSKYQIPMRFNALNIHTCKNQYKIMYNKEPLQVMTSFTILKPMGQNFSFIVFSSDETKHALSVLLERVFNKEAAVPHNDATKVADDISNMIISKLCFPNKKRNGEPLETTNKEKVKVVAEKSGAKKAAPKKAAEKSSKPAAKASSAKATKPAEKSTRAKKVANDDGDKTVVMKAPAKKAEKTAAKKTDPKSRVGRSKK